MGCCPSVPRECERNRDTEQGWHKNDSIDHPDRNVAELHGTSQATESRPETNIAELPGASAQVEPKPELDGTTIAPPHHNTVFEMESPISPRDGDTLPPPYAPTRTGENATDVSQPSPVSPMTAIDPGSPRDEKPIL